MFPAILKIPNVQVNGTTNTFPAFEEADGLTFSEVNVLVYPVASNDGACCSSVGGSLVAYWTSVLDPLLVPDAITVPPGLGYIVLENSGFKFSNFTIELPVGDYRAEVHLGVIVEGGQVVYPLFEIEFKVK